MHVLPIARYMLFSANIHPYLAMMPGLQNIGGVLILVGVYLYSNAKTNVHTSRGARLYFVNHVAMLIFDISPVQILMLSSNTKKGEIERAFPS